MEIINFRSVERSTQDVSVTINRGNSERWNIQSQKTKYVNGKPSGVIGVGYTASINNSDYLLEEDKSNNQIQITALVDGTSGLCVLTQEESGNKINLNITTPKVNITTPEEKEYWEIRFNPMTGGAGTDMSEFFYVTTNISGERGNMASHKNWIVNQKRYTINVHINSLYPEAFNPLLSWSCLDKNGNAFSPVYLIPDNRYFKIRTIGLGSYCLEKVSTPPVSNDTPILSSRFNTPKKYLLDLNFYWFFNENQNPSQKPT